MTCPECGSRTEVVKTTVALYGKQQATQRQRACSCGARLLTEERIVKRLPVVAGELPVVARGGPQPAPNPPATVGGSGGGVSSGLVPDSDPNPGLVVTPERVRARSERNAIVYPKDFDIVWEQTGRHGVKSEALKYWLVAGRPQWTAIQVAWRAYLLSERPIAGFVMDLSRWFKRRCHEQEWVPARANGHARPVDDVARKTAEMLERRRAEEAAMKPLSREEIEEIRRENGHG